MDAQVIRNFVIIGITLLIFFIIFKICKVGSKEFEKFGEAIAIKLSFKLNFRYSLVCMEILSFLMFLFLWINIKDKNSLLMILGVFGVNITTSTTSEVRRKHPYAFSVLQYIVRHIKSENYVTNRISLFINQLISVLWVLAAVVFTFSVFTTLKWPQSYYFMTVIAIPIYTTIWIYFNYRFRLNDEDTITMRRIMAYIVFAVYILVKTYQGFNFVLNEKEPSTDFMSFMLNSAYVVFFALEGY